MRKIPFILIVLSTLIGTAFQPLPQSSVTFIGSTHQYEFGKQILFFTTIQAAREIQSVDLFIRPSGESTRVLAISPGANGRISEAYDLTQHPLRPFSQVDYWYRVALIDGSDISSSVSSFFYEDNRFDWKRLEENGFEAAWQEGDSNFGQAILNVSQTGWANVQMYLQANLPKPLRVYVYASATDLQSALQLTNTPWVAGHASPDLGVVLVSIPSGPDQRAELERQIPHELMHVVEYQEAGLAYSRLPLWLVEGLASIAELYPNQDYERVMQSAVSGDRLVALVNLCSEFPRDLSGAFLAYAESASFVRFLYQNFGRSGLNSLITQYKDGYGCEEGIRSAFTETLGQLETRWKQEYLGLNMGAVVWKNLLPYLLLVLVIVLPVSVSLIPFKRRKELKP